MANKLEVMDSLAGEACPAPNVRAAGGGASLEGQRHGPLVLRRKLGAGALGSVYLAEYPPTGHRFAVKVLHAHLAARPAVRSRFVTEALAVRKLVHRHLARVLDVRPGPGGLPCVLMEYVDGEPLSGLPLPLSPVEAVELLDQALAGLEAAHSRGVVHRDLTLDNLVLTRDASGERRVKLLDFGASAVLAASLTGAERASGMVAGSPSFLAPEQWTGAPVDGRADVYALGVAGYLLVTGRLPFGFGRVGDATPPEPHALNACVPPGLSAVLLRALAQRPEDRFPDAASFRAALAECLEPVLESLTPLVEDVPPEEPRTVVASSVEDAALRAAGVAGPEDALPGGAMRAEVAAFWASAMALLKPARAPGVPCDAEVARAPATLGLPVAGAVTLKLGCVTEEEVVTLRAQASAAPRPVFGDTPIPLALVSAPPMEATAPLTGAPAGLIVRLGLPGSDGLQPVAVSDVAAEGFFAECAGTLPPLAARLPATLSHGGETVACECDVVRHVTGDEARSWGVASGVFVHFADVGEPLRQLLTRALAGEAEPMPDAELGRLLARAAAVSRDPYRLLGAAPDVDFAEVRRRAEAALRRLEAFQGRRLPAEQRRALEALRARVESARRTLGQPAARIGYDANRGNLAGVSRCLDAGVTDSALEALRRAFLSARPQAESRARALFTQGHALEVQRSLSEALSRYAQALALDPLNASWLRHYQALRQQVPIAPGAGGRPSGAAA